MIGSCTKKLIHVKKSNVFVYVLIIIEKHYSLENSYIRWWYSCSNNKFTRLVYANIFCISHFKRQRISGKKSCLQKQLLLFFWTFIVRSYDLFLYHYFRTVQTKCCPPEMVDIYFISSCSYSLLLLLLLLYDCEVFLCFHSLYCLCYEHSSVFTGVAGKWCK